MSESLKTVLVVSSAPSAFDWLNGESALAAEYSVEKAESVWDADDILKTVSVHAILLDFDLVDADALAFCRILQKRGILVPIIMVSDSNAASDAILSLEAGADDYVPRSVSFEELAARIRARMRTKEMCWPRNIAIKHFDFDPYKRLMFDHERKIHVRLTDKEARFLLYLAGRTNKFATKREICREIWEQNLSLNTHALNTHVYRLRRKIEIDPQHPRILVSESSGYRLVV